MGFHNQRISAQTVRNRLSDAHLRARLPHQGLDLTAVQRHHQLQWANAHMNVRFNCIRQMADSVYGVVWVRGLLMSALWTECPMGAVGLWYRQA